MRAPRFEPTCVAAMQRSVARALVMSRMRTTSAMGEYGSLCEQFGDMFDVSAPKGRDSLTQNGRATAAPHEGGWSDPAPVSSPRPYEGDPPDIRTQSGHDGKMDLTPCRYRRWLDKGLWS